MTTTTTLPPALRAPFSAGAAAAIDAQLANRLLGLALEGAYPGAEKWRRYAAGVIPREVELQFLADGVDFEKSLAYHRLVAELARQLQAAHSRLEP